MIELKRERVNFSDYGSPRDLELEAQVVQERARALEGCVKVDFQIDEAHMYWVYYREETKEDTERKNLTQSEAKMRLYLNLKKELGQ
jgi:hypothetical protein